MVDRKTNWSLHGEIGEMKIQRLAKRTLRRSAETISLASDPREKLHFLHIGKNAGNQVLYVANQINKSSKSFRIVTHTHGVRLVDLPPGERYFFSIRSPESRFKSAFYSRKRKGQPRNYVEWTPYEAKAFSCFEHANELAEALFQPGEKGMQALCAIKAIEHCSMDQIDWFDRTGTFLMIHSPVFIIRQERLEADLQSFSKRIKHSAPLSLTEDKVAAHKNDYSAVPPLSEKAKKNLYDWYRQDFEFYRICEDWINSQ
jgi:hypothetical protein